MLLSIDNQYLEYTQYFEERDALFSFRVSPLVIIFGKFEIWRTQGI
jgi:hypothetical protein